MGLDAAGPWPRELAVRSLGAWAQHRAGVDTADTPTPKIPPDVEPGLARVWSNPRLLSDPAVARWTVRWLGVILEAGFCVLKPGPTGPEGSQWAATVFADGVLAAATRATMPELVRDLQSTLPGLDRGLPWRPEGQAAAAEATVTALMGHLLSGPEWAGREVLMELVRTRPDRRLMTFAGLTAERLEVKEPLREPISHVLAAALARFLDGEAPVPEAPDPSGRGNISGMRAWADMEWEAGVARENHFARLIDLKLEQGAAPPPLNWRVGVAQRAQRAADESFRFALGRPPETVRAAADWQAAADLDLCDALRLADPDPGLDAPAGSGGTRGFGSWLRGRLERVDRRRRAQPGPPIR